MEDLVRALDFPAHLRQTSVFFMLGHVVRVNRHDDAAEPVVGEGPHVLLRPKRAVGANHRMNATLGRVAHHRPDFLVHERFAAHKQQIADVIFHRDVDDIPGFPERHAAALLRIEPVHRESAEVALRIADIRDGELEITRTAVLEHLTDQFENTFLRPGDGSGEIRRRPGRFRSRRVGSQGGDTHSIISPYGDGKTWIVAIILFLYRKMRRICLRPSARENFSASGAWLWLIVRQICRPRPHPHVNLKR